jgi:flagellar basal body-associated protein FliL
MAEKQPDKPAEGAPAVPVAPFSPGGKGKPLFRILLAAGMMIVGAGGGLVVGKFVGGPSSSQAAGKGPEGETHSAAEKFSYHDLEPIIVNLDEPRLARYVRVSITLAVKADNSKAATEVLDKKKPELKSWLTVYLAGCTLEQVRGANNLNRIRREILDHFNQNLWPEQTPLIDHVLLKEFAIQ